MTNEIKIHGYKITNLSMHDLLKLVQQVVQNRKERKQPALMLSANVYGFNLANKYDWLMKMNNEAEIIRNDSAGLQMAGKILGSPLKERLTWADFGWDLAAFCEKESISIYFLGNRPGIPEKAKQRLTEKYPDLNIVGMHHGYFNKLGEENDQIITDINNLNPDILIVGLGMPLQEKWILDNRNRLNVSIIMTGGNCFSFLSGEESRAPKWMHKNGLEWLYRLIKEPRRMVSRYIIGNPLFLSRVILQKMGKNP